MTEFLIYNVVMTVLCFILLFIASWQETDINGWIILWCLMLAAMPIVREFLILMLIVTAVVSFLDRNGRMEKVYFDKRKMFK